MLSDPIADMLTRIRNASAVSKKEVHVPFSKLKAALAVVLVKEGYLAEMKKEKVKAKGKEKEFLKIKLKYQNNRPAIKKIKRISRPGLRIYLSAKRLPRVLSGFGSSVVSTSQGIMSGRQAKKKNLGGELICQVW